MIDLAKNTAGANTPDESNIRGTEDKMPRLAHNGVESRLYAQQK